RELALDVLLGVLELLADPGDVEKHAAVGAATALAHLAPDAARDVVAGQQLWRAARALVPLGVAPALLLVVRRLAAVVLGDVREHEALLLVVEEDAALAADAFGDEDALDAGRPDHAGGMELDELHVDQRRTRAVGERVTVAGALPAVAGDLEGAPDAAGRHDDGRRAQHHETPVLALVREGYGDPIAVLQQGRAGVLHVDRDSPPDHPFLQHSH